MNKNIEVTYPLKRSTYENVMNALECIISANVEYKKDQLEMANNTIEVMQKYAIEIKRVLLTEFDNQK